MHPKNQKFSNFSRALHSRSDCFRPEKEDQIKPLLAKKSAKGFLAIGTASSYSDCCLNDQGVIIDTSRLNHLLSFDEATGILVCQGSVRFADLFFHPHFIPPVIPGTLRATVAGGIANDVHGKNNHQQGSFGDHLLWVDLELGEKSYYCSADSNPELYYATIAGLGLTGLIKRAGIKMRKNSHFVVRHSEKYRAWEPLLKKMQGQGCNYDYQVAWLDLLNQPRAILSFANHCETGKLKRARQFKLPKLPLRLIHAWTMKQFNRFYFKIASEAEQILPLQQFNNPLDSIRNWNHLYGKAGLLQFQALFNKDLALNTLEELIKIIQSHQATPTLAVLKYFTKSGSGLLSFAEPGFTLAIDFINNQQAEQAIKAMNEWITAAKGKIYLAKDLFLTEAQFNCQYPQHEVFSKLLTRYQSPMRSDLSRRLGLTPRILE